MLVEAMLNISIQTETYIYIYIYIHTLIYIQSFPSGSAVKNPPTVQEVQETLVVYNP